jgi:hypothetical protein
MPQLVFRIHAVQRMVAREISEGDVREVLTSGEVIESYPDDTPYPSRLVLGWRGRRPIHVVVADNVNAGEAIVITVYEPDIDHWEIGFRRRRER